MVAKQKGMAFIGMIVVALCVLALLLAAISILPSYIDFFRVKQTLTSVSHVSAFNRMSNAAVIETFDQHASLNAVTGVNGRDLIFSTDPIGGRVIAVQYEVVVPLAFNLGALMDFKASSGH